MDGRVRSPPPGASDHGPTFLQRSMFRKPAVDRILNGDKPADLTIQQPTKLGVVHTLRMHFWRLCERFNREQDPDGNAWRSHTLRSIPLCVLPQAQGTPEQVLLPDQGGIVLSCAENCALCRLCLHSVRRPEHSTSPPEIVPPAYALLDGFSVPAASPGVDAVQLLFVLLLGTAARPAQPAVVSAPRAPSLLGAAALQILLVVVLPDVSVQLARPAIVSAPHALLFPDVAALQLHLAVVPHDVDARLARPAAALAQPAVVSAPRTRVLLSGPFRSAAASRSRFPFAFSRSRSNSRFQAPTPLDLWSPTAQAKLVPRAQTRGCQCRRE